MAVLVTAPIVIEEINSDYTPGALCGPPTEDGCGCWCGSVGYYRLLEFNRTGVVLIHTSRVVVLR